MKLELKHIYPYLGYDVKILWSDDGEVWAIHFESEVDWDNKMYPLATLLYTIELINELGWKLCLHPLSNFKGTCREIMRELDCNFRVASEIWKLAYDHHFLNKISLETYNVMCEKHIDFHRLIDANLAVDINTIEL